MNVNGVRAAAGVLLAMALSGCAAAQQQSFVEPAWERPGTLVVTYRQTEQSPDDAPLTTMVSSRLTIGPDGHATAIRTAGVRDGRVLLSTTWTAGARLETRRGPECSLETGAGPTARDLPALLAQAFGPVDDATTAGWQVSGGVAVQAGPFPQTRTEVDLKPLGARHHDIRDLEAGLVASSIDDIRVEHVASSEALPALGTCGDPAPF